MKNRMILIDSGHGGVIKGVPQTAGKRSPDFGKGILYEGVTNRQIAKKTLALILGAGIKAVELVPEVTDVSLEERVKRANKYSASETMLISFHSNAGVETASGWEIFTTKGKTNSDEIAEAITLEMKKAFPKSKFRIDTSDGDSDKEEDFFILRKVNCPAVLIENFFMTNKEDYLILLSEEGQNKIANAVFQAIKKILEC
jgi:N-acetylmuramoyl-L-alanine amidase